MALYAVFHRGPDHGLAALAALAGGDEVDGVDAATVRWLTGVCLGAQGHYRRAAEILLPPGTEPDSLAASTRASHLRQLARHAEAESWDTRAVALAPAAGHPAVALADGLVGLVADAVGRADTAVAADRLATAGAHVRALDPTAHWRARVRLAWVSAEHAMLCDDPALARTHALDAVGRSQSADAPRHLVKSLLVLGVAGHLLGRPDAAGVLADAARRAEQLGVPTLVWPAQLVLARTLWPSDPDGSRRAHAQAGRMVRAIAAELAPEEARRFLATQESASA
jgi:hypothetical protein